MHRLVPRLLVGSLIALIAAMASPASAQDTGSIHGTVVDVSGQLLPGVTVTLTNERTNDAHQPPAQRPVPIQCAVRLRLRSSFSA
jgi:hypothetical protein